MSLFGFGSNFGVGVKTNGSYVGSSFLNAENYQSKSHNRTFLKIWCVHLCSQIKGELHHCCGNIPSSLSLTGSIQLLHSQFHVFPTAMLRRWVLYGYPIWTNANFSSFLFHLWIPAKSIFYFFFTFQWFDFSDRSFVFLWLQFLGPFCKYLLAQL